MKILFTGGSSFTGYWFIRELTATGHSYGRLPWAARGVSRPGPSPASGPHDPSLPASPRLFLR